ncbi:hypothetical protein H0H93_002817, partial [Arthromyces matolae]
KTSNAVTTHIDLAPTFFELAGLPLREDFDGTPIPLDIPHIKSSSSISHEHVTVEFWGLATLEGDYGTIGKETGIDGSIELPNNTYKSARILGEGYNLYYSVWCTNEHELYDLS